MLELDYCKARVLDIGAGRRFWQSTASPKNAYNFYVRGVKPLRQLQCLGIVEKLEEIAAPDDRTPIAVEIIGRINLPL